MGTKKIKTGIVGTGHGLRTIVPALESTKKFDVVAVAGSSIERVREKSDLPLNARPANFDELISDKTLELICIASPNQFHREQFEAAATSNANLYLEKPIATNFSDAKKLKRHFCDAKPRFIVLGHQLRFNPYIRTIRDFWQQGRFGQVYHVALMQRGGAFTSPTREWTWEFEKERGGGVRLAMGTHLLDLVNFISSKSPREIFANMSPVHDKRQPDTESKARTVDASNFFSASIDYGEFEASISTTAAAHVPSQFRLEVHGSEASAIYDGMTDLTVYRLGKAVKDISIDLLEKSFMEKPGSSVFRKSLCYMADSMADQIEGKKSNLLEIASTVDDGVEHLRVLDEAMSSRNKRNGARTEIF